MDDNYGVHVKNLTSDSIRIYFYNPFGDNIKIKTIDVPSNHELVLYGKVDLNLEPNYSVAYSNGETERYISIETTDGKIYEVPSIVTTIFKTDTPNVNPSTQTLFYDKERAARGVDPYVFRFRASPKKSRKSAKKVRKSKSRKSPKKVRKSKSRKSRKSVKKSAKKVRKSK